MYMHMYICIYTYIYIYIYMYILLPGWGILSMTLLGKFPYI